MACSTCAAEKGSGDNERRKESLQVYGVVAYKTHCSLGTHSVMWNNSYARKVPLQWRHNGRDGVSNYQPPDCLLNRLFGCPPKKISKLRVTGLGAGNSPWPVNSPHKWPATRKMFPYDDVIMLTYEKSFVFLDVTTITGDGRSNFTVDIQ